METAAHHPTAQRLIENKERILKSWEKRIREKVPSAKRTASPALINSLPVLIDRLAVAIDSPSPDQALEQEQRTLATEHGKQRAQMEEYSLDQVILEYQVL